MLKMQKTPRSPFSRPAGNAARRISTIGRTGRLLALCVLVVAAFPAPAQEKETAATATTSRQKAKTVMPADTSSRNMIPADYGKYAFSFTTMEGKKINLSDYAGRVVLVNIWAPWCGPCKVEIPGFARLHKKYAGQGFEILSVAVQTSESAVREFMKEYRMDWPVGLNQDVAVKYGTYGLPDNYLFGPDGSLLKHFVGYTREEALEPVIIDGLKTKPAK